MRTVNHSRTGTIQVHTPAEIAESERLHDEWYERKKAKTREKNKGKKMPKDYLKNLYWRCRSINGTKPPQDYLDDISEWFRRRQISHNKHYWRKNARLIGIPEWQKGEIYHGKYKGCGNTSICWDCTRYNCQWLQHDMPMENWQTAKSKIYTNGVQVISCSQYQDDTLIRE